MVTNLRSIGVLLRLSMLFSPTFANNNIRIHPKIQSIDFSCCFMHITALLWITDRQYLNSVQLMENESPTSKKRAFTLMMGERCVEVSGDFDSGNLNSARVSLESNEMEIGFGKDKEVKPSSKTWFYFSLLCRQGLQSLHLTLLRVNTLTTASKIYDLYRPVTRIQGQGWQRHSSPVDFEVTPQSDINLRMVVDIPIGKRLYIALTYPYSYQQNQAYLRDLQRRVSKKEEVYFNREVLVMSPQSMIGDIVDRPLHLIAISAADVRKYPQERALEHLFPMKEKQEHFREIHKPLVLITSRVHPGETGSSFALEGMLEFLVSQESEAVQLRNQFYFLVVPMLNPDGVWQGNNRMDALGQNLNRFYHLPDATMQPSCYAIKALVESQRKQLFAFFDLHGHANKKSCFLFGNSITNTRLQAQSVLFAKHLSTICDYIDFKTCNFSKKQMSSRDKNEDMSKEGCARVVVHKWTNSPYCYTLETGLFKNIRQDEKGIFRYGQQFYSPKIYAEVGAKMLISFGAILRKTPQIEQFRKSCIDYVSKMDKQLKKQKSKVQKVPKSLKSFKSQDTQTEQGSKQGIYGKQNEISGWSSTERVKEVSLALARNKGQLLNLNEEDDE